MLAVSSTGFTTGFTTARAAIGASRMAGAVVREASRTFGLDASADEAAVAAAAAPPPPSASDDKSDDSAAAATEPVDRKAAKKALKAQRRAKREGRAPKEVGQKACERCHAAADLLVRCTYDESRAWRLVCGRCWRQVSGGVADGTPDHPHYRYGGLWKKH